MSELFKADNINLYNEWAGVETQNPLVGFIDFSDVKPLRPCAKNIWFLCSVSERPEMWGTAVWPPLL